MSNKNNKKIAAVAVVATMVTQNIQPIFALGEINTDSPNAKDLIISEYVEGSSNNKAIEIYNGTGKTVNLSDYSVELYLNGSSEAGKKEILSGELENNKTYVIVNSQAGEALKSKADKLSGSVNNYNGDDAIVLKHNDEIIDSIGKVGEDPDIAWENNGVSTMDMTLIRKPSISEGDKNISDEFDPSVEWTALRKDTFENLGTHVMELVHGTDTNPPTGELVEQIKSHNISEDLEIRVKAKDNRRVESVVLYYRNKGDNEYKEMLLSKDNEVYVGIIEKDKLSTDGFEYYIGISDGTNTIHLPADKSNPYTIDITDLDVEGPTISRVYPSHNYNTGSELKPLIGADFNDRTGINTDSIKLTLDGVDITSKSEINEDSIRYTPENNLSEGNHNLKLELEDNSEQKNKTTKEWSFYIGEEDINTYFGQIHSHTSISDGIGEVDEAYDYARNKAKVDFLAITDHSNSFDNESLANINDGSASEEWRSAQATSNEKNDDGKFVAMYGYEMSWSASTGGYGHMNTYNTPGFESRTNPSMTLKKYYDTLKTQPQSISMFNHPGETFGDFEGFGHYDEEVDEVVTLIEVGNSDGDINSNNYFRSYDKYIEALDKGWHIAPTNGQDNHKGKWGDANTTRTVVQTSELTRENVYQAMRDRNVYATEDENLEIIYKINGNTMGSILDEVENLDFDITINDPDASDKISKVEIIANGGKTVKEFKSVKNNDRLQFTLPSDYSYYIVQVTQADGQKTITAPIWVGEMTKVGISSMESDKAIALVGEDINISTKLYNNEDVSATDVKVEYYLGNENNKIGETVVGTMDGMSEHTSNFTYTPQKAGSYNIITKVSMTVNGVELTSTEKVSFIVKNASQVSNILIDGSKQNDYVDGKYFDKVSKFSELALENGAKARINKDEITDEVLEGVSLLVISDPQSTNDKNNDKLSPQKYSESELAAIKKFVDNGGNLVITSKADYGDGVDDYQNSEQGNAVLEAIGASLRFNDDQLIDNENYSNQNYRLYFDRYNTDNPLLQGVDTTQTYSFYSGCSIIADESNENVDIIVKGHETTLSSDADKKGDATSVKEGEAVALAMETLESGAKVIVGGTTFFSDFELDKEEYSNDDIAKNIVRQLSPKPQLPITPIAEVRKDENNDNKPDNYELPFAIEGTVTVASSAASDTNAFFDCVYIQDETGGITVFGVSETPLKVGQKVRVEGTVDDYLGDTELMISNESTDITILDESINPIDPIKLSTADSMLESNEGLLVKVEGTVTKMDGQNIFVDDGSGVARAYVEGYIGSSSGADRDYTNRIAVGDKVSIVGLASEDGEDFADRLRVRDTDEIVKLENDKPEYGGTENGGSNNGGTNNGGTNNDGSNNGSSNNGSSNNGGSNNGGTNNENPQTGDVAMGGLFASVVASIAGLGFLNRRKRK